jgi:hypothetical protein
MRLKVGIAHPPLVAVVIDVLVLGLVVLCPYAAKGALVLPFDRRHSGELAASLLVPLPQQGSEFATLTSARLGGDVNDPG